MATAWQKPPIVARGGKATARKLGDGVATGDGIPAENRKQQKKQANRETKCDWEASEQLELTVTIVDRASSTERELVDVRVTMQRFEDRDIHDISSTDDEHWWYFQKKSASRRVGSDAGAQISRRR